MDGALPCTDAELAAHHAWLLRLAQRLAADEAEAQDLAQEAWATLLRRGAGSARDLRAFLGGIVRVRARRARSDAVARRARELRGARAEALPGPDQLLERLELSRVIADELRALPEAQRTLLLLRHQEGLSPAQIARRRNVPAGTVRAQLSRARDELRARLDRRHGGLRDAWCLAALVPLGRDPAPLTGALVGAIAMSAATKWGLAGALALGLAWFGWWAVDGVGVEREVVVAPPPNGQRSPAAPQPSGPALPHAPEVAGRSALAGNAARPLAPQESDFAPLTLSVVDARTGEPLAHYGVELVRHAGAGEDDVRTELMTDARGEATIPGEARAAPFELVAFDDPEDWVDSPLVRRVDPAELEGGEDRLELALVAGPTYELELPRGAPGTGELSACLGGGLLPEVGQHCAGRVRPPASAGARPWIRFDPEASGAWLGDAGPWTLTVRDGRGMWIAHGEVDRVVGRQVVPVLLEEDARGSLAVSVTIDGERISTELGVLVTPLEDGVPNWKEQRHVHLRPATGGLAFFGHLPAGHYRVSVGGTDLGFHPSSAEVRSGELRRHAVDLGGRADLAPLLVLVRSQTGETPLGGLSISAHREGEKFARPASIRGFEADGAARYEFNALPLGEWLITLEPTPHLPPWRETTRHAQAGGEPVEFLCLDADAPPTVRGDLRLVDAATGEPLPFGGVMVYVAKRRVAYASSDQDGQLSIGPFPVGARIELFARAEGRRGSLVALEWPPRPEESPHEIALRPGWGTLIETRQPNLAGNHGLPLAGVHVQVDGHEYGITDEHGHLLIALDAAPQSVRFVREGFHLQHSPFDPETGAPDTQATYPHWVVLVPDVR